jgi:hypothetical protein
MVLHLLAAHNVAKGMDPNGLHTVVDTTGTGARSFLKGNGIPVYAEGFRFNVKNKSQKSVK